MRIISDKRRKIYSWIVILVGGGVSMLTYIFIKYGQVGSSLINSYCILNSLLTLISGILLLLKKRKIYNLFSFMLGLSVLIGFFVPFNHGEIYSLSKSVSVLLTMLGFSLGSLYGGFIWVPLFLFNSFYGGYKAIRYWNKKVKYEFESDIIQA